MKQLGVLSGLLVVCLSAAAPSSTFDVRDYGAKGDCRTDDTAALRSAYSAAVTAGGGIVYLAHTPSNCYVVSGAPALTLNSQVPIVVRGDDRFMPTIQNTDPAGDTIAIAQPYATVADLRFDRAAAPSSGYAVNIHGGNFARVSDVVLGYNTYNGFEIGGADVRPGTFDKVSLSDIEGTFNHAGGVGIDIESGYSDIELTHVRLNANVPNRTAASAYALRARGAFDTLVMNYVYFQDCAYGIAFMPADGAVQQDIFGTNVIVDGMERYGLLAQPSGPLGSGLVTRALLTNLWVSAASGPRAIGMFFDGGSQGRGVDGFQIGNFEAIDSSTYGIAIDRANNLGKPIHLRFHDGILAGNSVAAKGTYPSVMIGLTTPAYGVSFDNVVVGTWGRVPSLDRYAYQIHGGSDEIYITGGETGRGSARRINVTGKLGPHTRIP